MNYYHINCLQFTNLLKSGAPSGLNYNLVNLVNTHFVINLITGCLPCSGRNYNNYISYVCLDLALMVKLLLNWKPITIIGPFELSWEQFNLIYEN